MGQIGVKGRETMNLFNKVWQICLSDILLLLCWISRSYTLLTQDVSNGIYWKGKKTAFCSYQFFSKKGTKRVSAWGNFNLSHLFTHSSEFPSCRDSLLWSPYRFWEGIGDSVNLKRMDKKEEHSWILKNVMFKQCEADE